MKRITFITTVNENYFYHLPRLLQSISDNFVGAKLVVYCVNVSDHNLNAQFLKNSNVEIEKHEICFDNFEHERGYCSNLRAQALNDVGQRLEDNNFLIYLDVNSLVLANFASFLSKMNEDIGLVIDTNHPCYKNGWILEKVWPRGPLGTVHFGVILAGIQIYKLGDGVRKLFNEYSSLVSEKNLSWFADQEAIFILFRKLKNISFVNIEGLVAVGASPNSNSIVAYRQGGATNTFYDDLSMQCFYKIENIDRNGVKIVNPDLRYWIPKKLNKIQRACRRGLLLTRRVIKW